MVCLFLGNKNHFSEYVGTENHPPTVVSWLNFILHCLEEKTHVAIYLSLMLAQSKKALTVMCG